LGLTEASPTLSCFLIEEAAVWLTTDEETAAAWWICVLARFFYKIAFLLAAYDYFTLVPSPWILKG